MSDKVAKVVPNIATCLRYYSDEPFTHDFTLPHTGLYLLICCTYTQNDYCAFYVVTKSNYTVNPFPIRTNTSYTVSAEDGATLRVVSTKTYSEARLIFISNVF